MADLVIGAATVSKGSTVWVMLNAREIAGGFVAAVLAGGWRPLPDQPVTYAPRPDLRLPSRIMVQQS